MSISVNSEISQETTEIYSMSSTSTPAQWSIWMLRSWTIGKKISNRIISNKNWSTGRHCTVARQGRVGATQLSKLTTVDSVIFLAHCLLELRDTFWCSQWPEAKLHWQVSIWSTYSILMRQQVRFDITLRLKHFQAARVLHTSPPIHEWAEKLCHSSLAHVKCKGKNVELWRLTSLALTSTHKDVQRQVAPGICGTPPFVSRRSHSSWLCKLPGPK